MLDLNDIDPSLRARYIGLMEKIDEINRQLGDSKDKALEQMSKEELELKLSATQLEYICCGLPYPLWEVTLRTRPESVRILQDCINQNKPLDELHPEVFPNNYDEADY